MAIRARCLSFGLVPLTTLHVAFDVGAQLDYIVISCSFSPTSYYSYY